MDNRVNHSVWIGIIAKTLPCTTSGIAGIPDFVEIPSSKIPHILGVQPCGVLISGVSKLPMVFAKQHFGEGKQLSVIACCNAALCASVVIQRLIDRNKALSGGDHPNVNVTILADADILVVHPDREEIFAGIKRAS